MDEKQVDAIAQAILQPDPKIRDEIQRKKTRKAWWLVERRKIAWLMLIGFSLGALVALYLEQRFTNGGVWGSVIGASVGWIWVGWRWHDQRRAA